MGCLQSKPASNPIKSDDPRTVQIGSSPGKERESTVEEQRLENAFKAKRGNVFAAGVDAGAAVTVKNIPKTDAQRQIISKFSIFVFN